MKTWSLLIAIASMAIANPIKWVPFVGVNQSNVEFVKKQNSAEWGFEAGLNLEIPINSDLMFFRTGASYSSHSSQLDESRDGTENFEQYEVGQINLPLLVQMKWNKLYFATGVEVSVFTQFDYKKKYLDPDSQEDNRSNSFDLLDEEGVSPYSLNLPLIVGAELFEFGPGALRIEGFYNYGLKNIYASSGLGDAEMYTRSYGARIGYGLEF